LIFPSKSQSKTLVSDSLAAQFVANIGTDWLFGKNKPQNDLRILADYGKKIDMELGRVQKILQTLVNGVIPYPNIGMGNTLSMLLPLADTKDRLIQFRFL
jgi:hypothetical protein